MDILVDGRQFHDIYYCVLVPYCLAQASVLSSAQQQRDEARKNGRCIIMHKISMMS